MKELVLILYTLLIIIIVFQLVGVGLAALEAKTLKPKKVWEEYKRDAGYVFIVSLFLIVILVVIALLMLGYKYLEIKL